jgi:hypothetical protein
MTMIIGQVHLSDEHCHFGLAFFGVSVAASINPEVCCEVLLLGTSVVTTIARSFLVLYHCDHKLL